MSAKEACSFIAGVLFLVAFVPYIRAILRRETKPSRASWFIWALLDTINLIGMWASHSLNGQIVGATAGTWFVVVLAIKYGESGWKKIDKICLWGAISGIALWQILGSPILGIGVSSVFTVVGAVPTIVGLWRDPSQEDRLSWTIWWLACLLAIFAIPARGPEHVMQPIAFLINETTVMGVLFIRPLFLRRR